MRRIAVLFLLAGLTQQAMATQASHFQSGVDFSSSQQPALSSARKFPAGSVLGGGSSEQLSQYFDKDIESIARGQQDGDAAVLAHSGGEVKASVGDALVATGADAIENGKAVIANTKGFCTDTQCADTAYAPNTDFTEAGTQLSALAQASKDETNYEYCYRNDKKRKTCETRLKVFAGKSLSCRDYALGYDNCCTDKGWGQSLGLAGCNSEEVELQSQKADLMCHEVGRYCSKHINTPFGKICERHSKAYCCFTGKLARVFQEQARTQLGWGWGTADMPYCGGFTPEQLQSLDVSRLDLSEYFSDFKAPISLPDNTVLTQEVVRFAGDKGAGA